MTDDDLSSLSVYGILKRTASLHPDAVSYRYFGTSVTYRSLLSMVDSFSSGLRSLGVEKGDRVVICLPTCPQAVIAFYAVNRIGAISAMVHPLSSKNEIEYYMKEVRCKVVLTLDMFVDSFPRIGSVDGFGTIIATSPVDCLPTFKRILAPLANKDAKHPKAEGPGIVRWKDVMKKAADFETPDIDADHPCAILFTGGTTGINKGALISSRSFNSCSQGMYNLVGLDANIVMLAEMPVFHGYGLCVCIHLPVMVGCEIVLLPQFTLDSICTTVVKERITVIAGVPSLYEKMFDGSHFVGEDLSRINGIFCGGDSIPPDTKARMDRFLEEHGCKARIRVGYGCTECLAATAISEEGENRPFCLGKPIDGHRCCIMSLDGTHEMPTGEEGEICISGPSLMLGYLNHEDETAKVLKEHDDGLTWLHTGDIGCMEEDGSLIFRSRIKRMIVTSGYNVYPVQIETVINSHPAVKTSCVIGVPDPMRGSRVKAYVILNEGHEADDAMREEIADFVKSRVSAFTRPREYEYVDSLPTTKLGKTDYRELERQSSEHGDRSATGQCNNLDTASHPIQY